MTEVDQVEEVEEEEEEGEEEEEEPTSTITDPVLVKIRRRDDIWPPKVPDMQKMQQLPCRIRRRDDMWPPKTSSVRFLPRTGFSPTVMREGGEGKKFIWPPPRDGCSPQLNDVGQLPHGHAKNAWNPDANALGNRPPPFAPREAPTRRCTDDVWPPKGSEYQPLRKSIPRPIKSIGRFEDYIKVRTGPNVPVTYRTPPGTQHIEIEELQGEFIHQSKTTTTVLTSSTLVKSDQAQMARRVEIQDEEEEEEEVEEVEEEEEEEEEESEEEEEEEE